MGGNTVSSPSGTSGWRRRDGASGVTNRRAPPLGLRYVVLLYGRRDRRLGVGSFEFSVYPSVGVSVRLRCVLMSSSLSILVPGGVDGRLGSYRGVWTAHRRAVSQRNLSPIEQIDALPGGPILPSSQHNSRCDDIGGRGGLSFGRSSAPSASTASLSRNVRSFWRRIAWRGAPRSALLF